ncbi:MAG: hypothetical protein JKY56_06170 [Kofleriaceae bacterium]|nr:hypothetical protein [Kofleriaceae bacterium]
MGRSIVTRVSPQRITVAVNGKARLQVQGRGHGSLKVGGERRWVWGEFDESFSVVIPKAENIKISVAGFGGFAQASVDCSAVTDIEPPTAMQRLPRLRVGAVIPPIRSLRVRGFRMPTIVRLSTIACVSNNVHASTNVHASQIGSTPDDVPDTAPDRENQGKP